MGRGPVSEERAALEAACRDLVIQSRRGPADAGGKSEDVAQDACVRALGLAQPERIRDPVRYVLSIARNLFIDRKRGEQRETRVLNQLGHGETKTAEAFDPERILAGKQNLESVLEAIEALPPRCREAFTLHRFEGLSYAAIARRMSVSTGTVEKHIAEAMLKLARSFRGP
jgi:RNA polymerase sigma-70 factor (ECF subfamily)